MGIVQVLDAFSRENFYRYRESAEPMKSLLFKLYKWLVYLPVLVLATTLCGLVVLVIAPFSPRLASRWFASLWARILFRASWSRLAVSGAEVLAGQRSYVVVANHLSQFDIPVLYGWLPLDLKWVMKKELRHIPILGAACAAMGHIFLDRSNRDEALRVLQQVKGELAPGTSILFFPEGTRSRNGKMKPFKSGAFMMAKDLDIPVLPVTLLDTDSILPPDGIDLRPGSARMIIHPPIELEEVRALSPGELRDRARAIIAAPVVE